MAHPEGGRDPKAYPGNFDGGLGKMLAITGFTAEVRLAERWKSRRDDTRRANLPSSILSVQGKGKLTTPEVENVDFKLTPSFRLPTQVPIPTME